MSITSMRCDRIEKTLEADPASSRLLGAKENTVFTAKNEPRKYCHEVIAVAQAIDEAGEDAARLTIRQIMGFAMPILTAKMQGKPLPPVKKELLAAAHEGNGNGEAKKTRAVKKEEPRPKAEAASVEAPRRKKSEPVEEAPTRKPKDGSESSEKESEPEPAPAPAPKPASKPEPAAKAEKPTRKAESQDDVGTCDRDKLPYVVGVAVNTLLISSLQLLEQYDKKETEGYRLIDKAVTDIQKITHIPKPSAKEATPADGGDDDAS